MIGGDFRKEKIVVGWTARGQPTELPAARPAREHRPVQAPVRYPAYVKKVRRGGVLPFRQRLQPDGEHLLILLHVIAADKPDHRVLCRYDRVDGHFRFLRWASTTASLCGIALCTGRLSRITRLTDRSCRPRLSAFSASPLAKNSGCLTSTP